jgi:hypothetical protein
MMEYNPLLANQPPVQLRPKQAGMHFFLPICNDVGQRLFVLEYLPLTLTGQAFHARRNRFDSYTERRPSRGDVLKWHPSVARLDDEASQSLTWSMESQARRTCVIHWRAGDLDAHASSGC